MKDWWSRVSIDGVNGRVSRSECVCGSGLACSVTARNRPAKSNHDAFLTDNERTGANSHGEIVRSRNDVVQRTPSVSPFETSPRWAQLFSPHGGGPLHSMSIRPAEDPRESVRSKSWIPHVPINSSLSPSFTRHIQPIMTSHEGAFFVPEIKFDSADHPLVSSAFEGYSHRHCATLDVPTPTSLASSTWSPSGRSRNFIPPSWGMGRASST